MPQHIEALGAVDANPFERAILIEGSAQVHRRTVEFRGYDAAIDAQQRCQLVNSRTTANLHGFAVA